MKPINHPLLILATAITFLSSCTERIDINLSGEPPRLVVEGHTTPEFGKQWVRLSLTTDYFYNQAPPAVSMAMVTIDDGQSLVELTESDSIPGLYLAPDDFVGQPLTTYELSIHLDKPVSDVSDYTATETMPVPTTDIDSIVVEYNDRWERWVIRLYAWDPPTEDYYLFNAMCNGRMLTDSLDRMFISDDKLFNGNYTFGALVQILNKDEVQPGDTVTLILSNISRGYYDFIAGAQLETQPKTPLFSGPAANVSSNLADPALGYFAAYTSAYTSQVVREPLVTP